MKITIPSRTQWATTFLESWTTKSSELLDELQLQLSDLCAPQKPVLLYNSLELKVAPRLSRAKEQAYRVQVAKELTSRGIATAESDVNLLEDCAVAIRTLIEEALKSDALVTQRLEVTPAEDGKRLSIKLTIRFHD